MDLKGPPDIPPSLPLKEKGPSELELSWALMHGAGGGMLLKARASKKLSTPLEGPTGRPGVTPMLPLVLGCWGAPRYAGRRKALCLLGCSPEGTQGDRGA